MSMTAEEVAASITKDGEFWVKPVEEMRRARRIKSRADVALANALQLKLDNEVLQADAAATLREAIVARVGDAMTPAMFNRVGELLEPIAHALVADDDGQVQ